MSKSSFKEITNIPLSNGKMLSEMLIYDDISYWEYCKSDLYNDLWKHNSDVLGILPNINLFLSKKLSWSLGIMDAIAKAVLLFSHPFIQRRNFVSEKTDKPTIMFRVSTRRWTFTKSVDGIDVSNNHYDNIIQHLLEEFKPCIYITDIPTLSVYSTYRKIYKYYKYDINCSTSYWSLDVWKRDIQARKFFTNVWNEIKLDSKWINKISSLLEVNSELFKQKLEYMLLCTCPYFARYTFLTDKMIQNVGPVMLVTAGEQSPMGLCWVFMGKKYSIPVIGLQHGINLIEDANPYLLRTHENNSDANFSQPLPTQLLVWGNYDYEFFVNEAYYPPERLKITGNQKYDVLSSTTFFKKDICDKYGLDVDNKKIILWATQSHAQDVDENINYMRAIFSAISVMENAILLIKPHPNEGEITMNLFKERMAEYPNLHVEYLPTKCNTTEIIAISDLMIMKNSTVGQDAICLNKPVVVLDFSDNPDAGNYVKDGVAAGVYQADELSGTISALLADDTELKKHRAEYIARYLYKLDGNSAKRCADAIMELINKNNMES